LILGFVDIVHFLLDFDVVAKILRVLIDELLGRDVFEEVGLPDVAGDGVQDPELIFELVFVEAGDGEVGVASSKVEGFGFGFLRFIREKGIGLGVVSFRDFDEHRADQEFISRIDINLLELLLIQIHNILFNRSSRYPNLKPSLIVSLPLLWHINNRHTLYYIPCKIKCLPNNKLKLEIKRVSAFIGLEEGLHVKSCHPLPVEFEWAGAHGLEHLVDVEEVVDVG